MKEIIADRKMKNQKNGNEYQIRFEVSDDMAGINPADQLGFKLELFVNGLKKQAWVYRTAEEAKAKTNELISKAEGK